MNATRSIAHFPFATCKPEVRAEGKTLVLSGRALPWNDWSQPIYGYFKEKFARNAFTNHLNTKPDIVACIDHDWKMLLGRTSSGNTRINQTEDGLHVEVDAGGHSYTVNLIESIKRGDIRGMSFMFDTITDNWYTDDGMRAREVIEAQIFEVCFTMNPAYLNTTAEVGSRMGGILPPDEKQIEQWKEWVDARFASCKNRTLAGTPRLDKARERMKKVIV